MEFIYYILIVLGVVILFYIIIPVRRIFNQNRTIKEQSREIANKNQKLEEQNARLEELNREKNEIISFVSHDLKAPLNRVFALTNLIEMDDQNLSDDQKEYIRRIQTVVGDGLSLIRNMLDIRAIDDKGIAINPEELSPASIMGTVVRNYKQAADRKDIKLEFTDSTDRISILTDRQYLERIFDNLLSNSIKFTPLGSQVNVTLDVQDDMVIARFMDDGPGIKDDEMNLLFKKFEVLSSKPTGGESSNGLGLSIAKHLAESMGGSISVNNLKDRGAEFIVSLPIKIAGIA